VISRTARSVFGVSSLESGPDFSCLLHTHGLDMCSKEGLVKKGTPASSLSYDDEHHDMMMTAQVRNLLQLTMAASLPYSSRS